MSREALFNTIVVLFMGFFALFGAFLYPNAGQLHFHEFADTLEQVWEAASAVARVCICA